MRRIALAGLTATLALSTLTAPAHAALPDVRQVKAGFTRIASGLSQPVALTHPEGDSRLFVVERPGRIRVIRNGVLRATPFLDIHTQVRTSGEGGLLGLAFRPDYRTSGVFFVSFTDSNMTLRIVRYHANPTSDVASPTGTTILSVPHPGETNHNGGQIAFGPAGYLFIGTGDGGGTADPNGNAQNVNSLSGKILRINVTGTSRYTNPSSNPYYGSKNGRDEVWVRGLRNPWRFSWDRGHYTMVIGDVGQGAREEIDVLDNNSGGLNLGWDCREGTTNTASQYGGSYCTSGGYFPPLHEYDHGNGRCAIIGGYIYRGARYRSLVDGRYVYGDYCSGNVWLLGRDSAGRVVAGGLNVFPGQILAFGRDAAGELYLLSDAGGVYRMSFAHR